MAKQTQVAFKGIQRAIPQNNMPDGACQEIINLRPRKGCWRPIAEKKIHKSIDVSAYSKVFLHDIEGGLITGESNWIGLKNLSDHSEVYLINQNTGAATVINNNLDSSIPVNVVFLKRTMLITTGTGILIYIWSSGQYAPLSSLPVPDIDITVVNNEKQVCDESNTFNGVLGYYFSKLNSISASSGKMYGSIMYISAYRLFDGSYILPSIPRYVEISNTGELLYRNPDGGSMADAQWRFEFYAANIKATINNELYNQVNEGTKDLIESVCLFATRATSLHKIEQDIMTDQQMWNYLSKPFKDMFTVSDKFKKMAESAGWYKIHEFPFEEVASGTGRKTMDVDTTDFYQDYATRDTLPTDQFTHHFNVAKSAYVYNDRLHILNIKTSLGLPYVIWPDSNSTWGIYREIDGFITIWLKSTLGKAIRKSSVKIPVYRQSTLIFEQFVEYGLAYDRLQQVIVTDPNAYINEITVDNGMGGTSIEYQVYYRSFTSSDEYFVLPEIVGYNDSRAYKMQIAVNTGSGIVKLFEETLTKNSMMNFATWNTSTFSSDQASTTANFIVRSLALTSVTEIATVPAEITLPFDTNRLQVSEIQNPLIYPTKNSYQIGTGEGLSLAAGSEPLSTGQFGQFPLQVFTSKGIWALEIGTGDVLYTNILPVNAEVINNADNIVPIGSGVVYTTETGLYLINGRQVVELAEIIENQFDLPTLLSSVEIGTLLSDSKHVPGLHDSLSSVNFLDYLLSSTVGYDHLNKELVVTNSDYQYSYIYSFESSSWFKISKSYRMLVNNYPKLLGVTGTNVESISEELNTNAVECLVISAAQHFEAQDTFKKVERAVLRCKLITDTGKYSGVYLFASDDLLTWEITTGKQRTGSDLKDLMIQRSHGTSKFYAFVFAGKLFTDSEIKQIDMIYNIKWNNRLR